VHAEHDHDGAGDGGAHDHSHAGHTRGDHDQPRSEQDDGEEPGPDISGWVAAARTTTCPACGASGALSLGGGVFCPACGETSMSPGYTPPPTPGDRA
jgi:hypothetical protein